MWNFSEGFVGQRSIVLNKRENNKLQKRFDGKFPPLPLHTLLNSSFENLKKILHTMIIRFKSAGALNLKNIA